MIRIANDRAEKAARKLAKQLGTTVAEAIAIACEQALAERDAMARRRHQRSQLDRVLDEIWKQHPLPESAAERSRLACHDDLYDEYGLPK